MGVVCVCKYVSRRIIEKEEDNLEKSCKGVCEWCYNDDAAVS